MPMKQLLSPAEAQTYGIAASSERMENGELRFRLMGDDGSGYVRTVGSADGAWQNSHYHETVAETYIVQREWAALVELVDDALQWTVLRAGDVRTTRIRVPHNVYLPGTAVLHTVKHGEANGDVDWHESRELDTRTRHLTEREVLALVK